MENVILMTGGTGFLGTKIVSALIQDNDNKIYVLTRAKNEEEGYHRLKAAWYPFKKLYDKIGIQVFPVTGDIIVENLGMEEAKKNMLQKEATLVLHTAAEVGLTKNKDELMSINRDGTANVLAFAKGMEKLERFVHVSTAYVAGQKKGLIKEELHEGIGYANFYEQSKAEAEKLVRESGLAYSICRPGMIIGDSKDGWVKNFNTVYYVLKLLLQGKIRVLPVDKDMGLNVVPVDYVAESIVKIAFDPVGEGKIFHLTCPQDKQPKAKELLEYSMAWAKDNLGVSLPKVFFVPSMGIEKAGILYNRKEDKKKDIISNLLLLSPYFATNKQFERTNSDAIGAIFTYEWREYMDSILAYACRKNFMHQYGKTVFEQAMDRRNSVRHPMHFHDVNRDGVSDVTGQEVNDLVQRIVDALYAWGVRKGDKIALTGINSVQYMALDMALGISGCVSVPIYYTTPIDEVQLLLDKSGAKWLFVGDKRIMQQIEKLAKDIKTVVFSDGLSVHKTGVIHWEQFLYEANAPAPRQSPDPEDLATIRYTSGTTGEPKGVKFNFAQLAWMGEVLTNLVSWESRNRPLRYLSFLPLSHVVEGILASYAPYYMVADVDFYFLNDFGSLTEALPKVRPTIFFSVPRFYEKLWDQMSATKTGETYLKMKDGPMKKALAVVLKRALLRKAGLDACEQLIVGSAPISESLLRNYRELGIEIYNAYGQAEAPLITINRLNDNVIPTIGTPLPETTVMVAEDGELIVKGPQVCLGYYGLETDTIKDGVLKTGDLGYIGEDGHIILQGRKKEMIITAYGKNISIPKIEERLKSIPGIAEAVLIGEKRPYCTALLWLERPVDDLDAKIAEMNENLSHPETIRRYTIIETPLSIAKGELTPNLKVKRANIEAHYAKEIEVMYL